MELLAEASTAVAGVADGSRVTYAGAFPSTDLQYDSMPDGVKETLLLNGPLAPTKFRFRLRSVGGGMVTAVEQPDGSAAVALPGSTVPLFVLAAPSAVDAGGRQATSPQGEPLTAMAVQQAGED